MKLCKGKHRKSIFIAFYAVFPYNEKVSFNKIG